MDYNKTILSGRLTRDPEIREATQTGNIICKFGVASNRTYKKKDGTTTLNNETVFVDCVAFGKTGEVIGKYFTKGKPILIDGRLHFSQWEDQSGNSKNKLEVIVDSFVFMGGKSDEGNQPQAAPQAAQAAPQAAASDEDVPF